MIFLLRAHSRMLARRVPKPATRVDSLAQCNHAVNLIILPFLYCLALPLLYRQALYSLNLYSLQRSVQLQVELHATGAQDTRLWGDPCTRTVSKIQGVERC